MKLAAAPISWGVCEVPGWGVQLSLERVLADASRLGLREIEAGPPGFLPPDPQRARALLEAREMRIVGAFVTAVLHEQAALTAELRRIERQASHLEMLGGSVLVIAAASGRDGYEEPLVLDRSEWGVLLGALQEVIALAARHRLRVALHPHVGTAIERADAVERILDNSDVPLCLDTGHVFIGGADPVALARRHGARVAHVHLKDVDAGLAAGVRGRRLGYADAVARGLYKALGDGAARIGDVLDALRAARYEGWGVLEQDIAIRADEVVRDPSVEIARSRDFALKHA